MDLPKNMSFWYMKNKIQNSSKTRNGFFLLKTNSVLIKEDFDFYKDADNIFEKDKRTKMLTVVKNESKTNIWFFFKSLVVIPSEFIEKENLYSLSAGNFILTENLFKVIYLFMTGWNILIFSKIPGINTLIRLLGLYLEYTTGSFPLGNLMKSDKMKVLRRANNHLLCDTSYTLLSEEEWRQENKININYSDNIFFKEMNKENDELSLINDLCEEIDKASSFKQTILNYSGMKFSSINTKSMFTNMMFDFRNRDLDNFMDCVDPLNQTGNNFAVI